MSSKPKARLYYDGHLSGQECLVLSKDASHYICNVLRVKLKSEILLFNEREGEWLVVLEDANKKAAVVKLIKQQRKPEAKEKEIILLFAPLKKDRMDFLIEKAVELGVTKFMPIITAYSDVQKCPMDRLKAQIKEAVEQCERLDMPMIESIDSLQNKIACWSQDVSLYFCQEKGKAQPIAQAITEEENKHNVAFLVGPAGGFSDEEIAMLQKYSFVTSVHLGPRILRAETAVVACLSVWQAIRGDWQHEPNVTIKGTE